MSVCCRCLHHKPASYLGEAAPGSSCYCCHWEPLRCLRHLSQAIRPEGCPQVCLLCGSHSHCWSLHAWYIHQSDPGGYLLLHVGTWNAMIYCQLVLSVLMVCQSLPFIGTHIPKYLQIYCLACCTSYVCMWFDWLASHKCLVYDVIFHR